MGCNKRDLVKRFTKERVLSLDQSKPFRWGKYYDKQRGVLVYRMTRKAANGELYYGEHSFSVDALIHAYYPEAWIAGTLRLMSKEMRHLERCYS
jgi:hypothetical protein